MYVIGLNSVYFLRVPATTTTRTMCAMSTRTVMRTTTTTTTRTDAWPRIRWSITSRAEYRRYESE